tara:strand:- start:366 stop:761 length:396 start_codon:yes stop_codon:yes gene_type:complete
MRTNRSPLNQDLNKKGTPYQGVAPIKGMSDEVARNIDEDEYSKPTQRDINTAKQANEKMKMLKDKSFDHRYNKGELLDEVVIQAKPKSISRKSALNMLGVTKNSSPLDCWRGYERVAGTKEFSPGSCKKAN